MTVTVVAAVWKHSKSAGTQRLVLVALADEAQDDGRLVDHRRSLRHIAGKCNVHPDTVARAVRSLVELGELEVLEKGDGRKQTDYRVLLPGLEEGAQSAAPRRGGRGRARAGAGAAPSRPPSSRSNPQTLKASGAAPPERKGWSEQADTLTREWWESQDPKPVQPFPAVAKIVDGALRAGWHPDLVRRGLREVPCVSGASLDLWRRSLNGSARSSPTSRTHENLRRARARVD